MVRLIISNVIIQSKISLFFIFLVIISICDLAAHAENRNYLHPSNRPYSLGDRYCGAYVIWHALNFYNIGKPIKEIVSDLGIENHGACSIDDVSKYLKDIGFVVKVVRIDVGEISKVNKPFIMYSGKRKNQVGHVVFCVPVGDKKIIEFDGIKEPIQIETLLIENAGDRWDGTCILLDRKKLKDYAMNKVVIGSIATLWLIFGVSIFRKILVDRKEVCKVKRNSYAMLTKKK
jgi:ABC-type bacteriocin/lantibiotic exporter with double-glycine peptidase domain